MNLIHKYDMKMIKLTGTAVSEYWVNIDQIVFIKKNRDHTIVYLNHNDYYYLQVKETVENIINLISSLSET